MTEEEFTKNGLVDYHSVVGRGQTIVKESYVLEHPQFDVPTASLYNYDKYEVVKFEDLPRALQKLQKSDLIIAGNDDTRVLAYNGYAVIFHVLSATTVDADTALDKLAEGRRLCFQPDSRFRIVSYKSSTSNIEVIFEIPEAQFLFKHVDLASRVIWHPKMWMKVDMTHAYALQRMELRVVAEDNVSDKKVRLAHPLLPNIGRGAWVCTGDVKAAGVGAENPTLGKALQFYHDLLFSSEWNYDLLDTGAIYRLLDRLGDALPKEAKTLLDANEDAEYRVLGAYLATLADRDAMHKLDYKVDSVYGEDILNA